MTCRRGGTEDRPDRVTTGTGGATGGVASLGCVASGCTVCVAAVAVLSRGCVVVARRCAVISALYSAVGTTCTFGVGTR